MYLISHRGNVNGINKKKENDPEYINHAIQLGYDVEIDVHTKNNHFFLGHDGPLYKVTSKFLLNKKFWCHAKTIEALVALKKIKAHYFWHQEDDYTITSKGFFWTFPGKKLVKNSICVLPERFNIKNFTCSGICSDYIENYKKK